MTPDLANVLDERSNIFTDRLQRLGKKSSPLRLLKVKRDFFSSHLSIWNATNIDRALKLVCLYYSESQNVVV